MSVPRLPVLQPARPSRPKTRTPERKALHRAYCKSAYEARKAAGVCAYTPGCGNRTNGTVYCDECREVERLRKVVYKEERTRRSEVVTAVVEKL